MRAPAATHCAGTRPSSSRVAGFPRRSLTSSRARQSPRPKLQEISPKVLRRSASTIRDAISRADRTRVRWWPCADTVDRIHRASSVLPTPAGPPINSRALADVSCANAKAVGTAGRWRSRTNTASPFRPSTGLRRAISPSGAFANGFDLHHEFFVQQPHAGIELLALTPYSRVDGIESRVDLLAE